MPWGLSTVPFDGETFARKRAGRPTLPRSSNLAAGVHDLPDNSGQIVLLLPVREVLVDFGEIGDVANVVADPVGVLVAVFQLVPHVRQDVDGLQNRYAVLAAATHVVDLAAARRFIELQE